MINKSEFTFIFVVFIVLFSISQLPVLHGYLIQTPEMKFVGRTIGVSNFFNVKDYANQAKEGNFLFTTHATPEPVPYLLLNTYFWLIGYLSYILTINIEIIYFLFSIIGGFIFFVVLYYFISLYSRKKKFRKTAFIITLTSAGFGILFWLWLKSGRVPYIFAETTPLSERIFSIDLWLTDAFPLLSLYAYPYHIAAITFMIVSFFLFLKGWNNNSYKHITYSAIITFILATFHPYDPITIYSATILFAVISYLISRKDFFKKLKLYLLFILISIPPTLYNIYIFLLDPVYIQIARFNFQISPNPFSYILGGGIPFLLALYYLLKKVIPQYKTINSYVLFLAVWGITNYLLAYSPLVIQRRLILGMHIPIAILASLAIFEYILPRFDMRKAKFILVGLIILMLPTTFFFMAKETYKVGLYPEPSFVHIDDLEAIEWINEHTERNDIVFSEMLAGTRLTAISHKVFLSNPDMTINSTHKKMIIEKFFTIDNNQERFDILKMNNIKYVYYGKEEKNMSKINPEDMSFLEKVFENDRVKIFKFEE